MGYSRSPDRRRGPTDLFIGNMSYEVDKELLWDEFDRVAKVKEVTVIRDKESGRSKGYAFIEMYNHDDARAAKEGLDGVKLCGRPIRIDFDDGLNRKKEGTGQRVRHGGPPPVRGGARGGGGGVGSYRSYGDDSFKRPRSPSPAGYRSPPRDFRDPPRSSRYDDRRDYGGGRSSYHSEADYRGGRGGLSREDDRPRRDRGYDYRRSLSPPRKSYRRDSY